MTDMCFCLLHSCRNRVKKSRLVYYIYMMQQQPSYSGFIFKFGAEGLYSDSLDGYISEMACEGLLVVDDGHIQTTPKGDAVYASTHLSENEWRCADWVFSTAEKYTDDELIFVCMSDILVQDTLKRRGVEGLMTDKGRICSALQSLSRIYSSENFNNSLKVFKHIRSGLA